MSAVPTTVQTGANDPWAFAPIADATLPPLTGGTPIPAQVPATPNAQMQPLPGGTPGESSPVAPSALPATPTSNPAAFDPITDPSAPQEYIPQAVRSSSLATPDMAALQAMPSDQAFDTAVRLNKGDLRWPLEYFKGIDPDAAAKVQQFAQTHDTTFEIANSIDPKVRDNITTAQNVIAQLSARDANGNLIYPATNAWLKNPTNMLMGRDDAAALADIETAVRNRQQLGESSTLQLLRSVGSGMLSTASGILRFPAMMTALFAPPPGSGARTDAEARQLYNATNSGGLPPIQDAAEPGGNGTDPDAAPAIPPATLAALKAPFQPLPDWLKTFWGGATALDSKANAIAPVSYDGQTVLGELRKGNVGSAAAVGLSTILQQAPAIGLTALQPELGLSEMGASSGGETYGRDEAAGKPQDKAALNGAISFLANYFGGKVIGHAAILEDAKAALNAPQSLTSVAGQMVKGGVKGAVAQGAIQGTQDVGDYATGNKNALDHETSNLLNAAIIGFSTDALATVPMAAMDGAIRLRAARAGIDGGKGLAGAVAASKMPARDPSALAQHITASATAAGQPLTIGVDGDKVTSFYQGNTDGLASFASDMGTTPEAIQEAAKTGSEVALPIGPYYAKYAGRSDLDTAINQDLRYTPGGLSAAELPAETARVQGMFDAITAELGKTASGDGSKLPDQVATMRDTMMRGKEEGGAGYSAEQADSQISVMMAGLENLSARRGESVEDTINRLGLELRTGGEMIDTPDNLTIRNQGGSDEERAAKRSALQVQEPVEVDTTPFGNETEPEAVRAIAKGEYQKQKALGPVTTADGRTIDLPNSGFRKAASHSADLRVMRIVPGLRDMLGKGTHLWSEQAHGTDENTKAFHHYAAKARLDGRDVYSRMVIREDVNGQFHYDHDVSSVEEIENPAAHEKQPGSGPEGAQQLSKPPATVDDQSESPLSRPIQVVAKPTDRNKLRQWWHRVNDEPDVRNQPNRGAISFANGKTVIHLFKTADLSSFLHETGHLLFHEMQGMVDQGIADPSTAADLQTLHDFAGVAAGGKLDTEGEEKIVKAFEAYLREGKAPSIELSGPFARIRSWLTSVYRTIASLGVEPSDAVRNVFDRMLASHEDIADAQEYYSRKGEVLNLIKADEAEKNTVRQKLATVQRSELDKQTSAYLKSYLKAIGGVSAVRDAAKKEVEGNKVYKALADAREGKISAESIEATLGKAGLKDFKVKYPSLVSTDGEHTLQSLALAHDFESPQSLADNLTSAVPKTEAIKNYTQRLVAAKEQELRDEITKRGATPADGAMHTNASLSYLIAETQLMAKQLAGNGRPTVRMDEHVYRDAAREAIGNMSVKRAVRHDLFAKAEARLGRQVLELAKKGQWEDSAPGQDGKVTPGALTVRMKQMAQHAMVQEAIAARDERRAIERRYSSAKLEAKLKNVERSFRDPVRDILSTYGLSDQAPSAPVDLRELNTEDPALFSQIPTWIVYHQHAGDYRNLTFSQLQDVDGAARSIMAFGNDSMKSLKADEEKTTGEWVANSVERMAKLKSVKVPQQGDGFAYKLLDIADKLKSDNAMTQFTSKIADHFDETGPFSRLYARMKAAEYQHGDLGRGVMDDLKAPQTTLRAAMERIQSEYGKSHFDIPELPLPDSLRRVGRGRWTPEMLTAFMMNTGNEGNRTALKNAYNYDDSHIAKVASHFTKDELEAVQKTWDAIDKLYEPLERTNREVYDRDTAKVQPSPQRLVSRDGEPVDLDGGYYPLVFDHEINDRAGRQNEDDLMKNKTSAVFRATKPEDGMVQGRTIGHALPPYLTMDVLGGHINDTARFIAYAAVIRDFNRVSREPSWKSTFVDKFGNRQYKAFRDWIQYQAVPRRHPTSEVMKGWDAVADWTRARTTTAVLGWKATTALLWRTSMINSAVELGDGKGSGWKWMGEGYKFLGTATLGLSNTEGAKWIFEKSKFMANNHTTFDREIRDEIAKMRPDAKVYTIPGTSKTFTADDVRHTAYVWAQMNDFAIKAPTWVGGYLKYMQTLAEPGDTEAQTDAKAIEYADQRVQNSQPSAMRAEMNGIQRSEGWTRFLTMFMTWGMKYGNRLYYNNRAWQEGAISNQQYISHVVHEVLLEPWARLVLASALAGTAPAWWQYPMANMSNLLQWIPGLSSLTSMAQYGFSTDSMSSISEPLKRANNIRSDLKSKEFNPVEFGWDLARMTEFMLGIPALNVVKDLVNTGAAVEGEKKPLK